MRRIFRAIAALAFAAGVGAALPAPALAQLPPLIDREILFGDPELAGAQVSPDGRFISFIKPHRGQMNVWVKGREEPFAAARPLTADSTRPVTGYFWSRDGRYVLYVQDKGGNENFHVYAVDPGASAEGATGIPPARDLTPYGNVQAQIVSVPEKAPDAILVALNDRDPAKHDVYRVSLLTGARTPVIRNDANVLAWTADLDGNLRLGTRMAADGNSEVLRVEGERLTPVVTLPCGIDRSCGPARFHKDGRRVYLVTTRPGEDLTELVLHDLESGRQERVESDPERQVDFGGAAFSNATDELTATFYVGDRLRVYPRDPQTARDYETVRRAVGDGDVYFGAATRDDRLHVVSVTSDVDPGATYLYDRASGRVELLYRPYPNLPTQHLAGMRPVRYRARDGVEVPAYLTLPKGVEPRSLPAIILPHGGPWARDYWGYDPLSQLLANRGYAVLQPNFRGSTGYGARFLDLGNDGWGTGAMQHDLSDGVRWLVEQGIADPRRVGIMGGSYGGYATLAGVAFTPELYAAGVSIVGPSNLVTLLQSIPPYWAPIKRLFDLRLGSLDDPADVERMKAQSPLFSATSIRAPLLVIQGANDPRVNKAESDQIVVALRDLGRPVEYVVAPDEGHGFARRENRLAMVAAIEPFLARHLGGRQQEGTTPEVGERLALLTVDVDTLTLKPPVEAEGPMPAFSGAAIRPVTARYKQTMVVGGGAQTIELTSTTALTAGEWEGKPVWVVVEQTESTAIGAALDSVFLDRATLLPVRRSVRQGPVAVELAFAPDGAVKGSMQMGGETMPISAKEDGALLMDGMTLYLAVSTLPLAPGYTAPLRTFDLLGARTARHRLEVKGVETVVVPGATAEAFRVEIAPVSGAGGSTVWIERAAPHRVLKARSSSPEMGGTTATAELVGGG
ncbi:MAG TPA: alpha/beta fold hydrolase [Longimicrobiaceae bacterium]|nr:alpha/beta fold hydrolase [Longimicrobiaceae bacterium]